jgi:excisionase family DNA binding protein
MHPRKVAVRFSSVADAATQLGICVNAVGRLIRDSDLPSCNLGSRLLIPAEVVDAFTDNLTGGAA